MARAPSPVQSSVSVNSPRTLGVTGPHAHWWITAVVMLGFTTAGLSITVVNLAFPKIMTSLRTDLNVMQWVQTGYMIMQAVMMPSVGWLGARLGNRRLYLLALGTFVGGSVLCGLAWDVYSLIGFRLIQAMGAGPLFPISQVMLFQAFPAEKRGLAMGISSLGFSFGPMLGPVLGGYLLDYTSWRAVEKQLNKGENVNKFARAISFGNNQEFLYGDKVEQEIAEGCRRLIKNAIICWNYLYLTQKIAEAESDECRQELIAAVRNGSVATWQHVNLHGEYDFSDEKLQDSIGLQASKILSVTEV